MATAKGSALRCVVLIQTALCAGTFFSCLDGLSKYLRASLLLLCGFRYRLALDVERTCELAERLALVHHIPEEAISDWIRRSLRGANFFRTER